MLPWIVILGIMGVGLVIVEALMPGFGIFGIGGFAALLASTVIIFIEYGLLAFLVAIFVLIVLFFLLILLMKKSGVYKKVILTEKQDTQDFDESTIADLVGKKGKTMTQLRPYGKAKFEDREVDVFSEGGFIEKQKDVQVIRINGKNVTVKEI